MDRALFPNIENFSISSINILIYFSKNLISRSESKLISKFVRNSKLYTLDIYFYVFCFHVKRLCRISWKYFLFERVLEMFCLGLSEYSLTFAILKEIICDTVPTEFAVFEKFCRNQQNKFYYADKS